MRSHLFSACTFAMTSVLLLTACDLSNPDESEAAEQSVARELGLEEDLDALARLRWRNIVNLQNRAGFGNLQVTALRPFRGELFRIRISNLCGRVSAGDVRAFGFDTLGFPIELPLELIGIARDGADNPEAIYYEVAGGQNGGATVRTVQFDQLAVERPFGCTLQLEQARRQNGGFGGPRGGGRGF